MGPDIRIPLGALFTLLGVVLTLFGLASSPARYRSSLGIDINLWWGLVLIAFGAAMLALAWRSRRDPRGR